MTYDAYTAGLANGLANSLTAANRNIDKANAIIQKQADENASLRGDIATLKLANAVLTAEADGLNAQVMAMAKQHADSPLLVKTDIPYTKQQGTKSKLRLIFEQAFDATAKKLGVSNPASRRID